MELYEMKYFCVVYETRNISFSATTLNVSQPAISQCIKKIESELGSPCFIRNKRILQSTPLGDLVYNYCKQILSLKESMDVSIYKMTNSDKAEIRVGMSPFYCKYYLPDVFQSVREQYPNIKLTIAEQISEQQERMLLNGELDFCCIPQEPEIDGLAYESICMEEILLAIPPKSPLISYAIPATPIPYFNIEMLKGQKMVKLKDIQKVSKLLNPLLDSLNLSFDTAYETLDWDTVNVMIANNVGFGFVPDLLYKSSRNGKTAEFFRISNCPFQRRYSIAYKKDRELSSLEKGIIALIKKTICEYRARTISFPEYQNI